MNYYNYFTEIEETFVRRRGRNLFLSPLDWALIEGWQDRGVPLHIVIRSIESVFDVFDKQPPGTRTIKTLFYCREEIEVQYLEWVASQAGKSRKGEAVDSNGAFSIEDVSAHIGSAVAAFKANENANMREDLDRACARLDEMNADLTNNFEVVDKTLADVERFLDRALISNWDPVHLKTMEKEVATQLKAYKAEMDKEDYRNTFELMLLKRLREEAGIPRLSLFYL